jgi:hypothetical protein
MSLLPDVLFWMAQLQTEDLVEQEGQADLGEETAEFPLIPLMELLAMGRVAAVAELPGPRELQMEVALVFFLTVKLEVLGAAREG